MNLYFKFLVLIIKRLWNRKRQSLHEKTVTHFRVGLLDLDLNFHMNNGRFLSVMDLGRFDLMMKTGYFYKLVSAGYFPVVLSESIIFKKSLTLFQRYQLHTSLDGWDKNFLYMTQKFYVGKGLVASANLRCCFKKRGQNGIVTPKSLFEFIGEPQEDIRMTEIAKKQIELDEVLLPRKPRS